MGCGFLGVVWRYIKAFFNGVLVGQLQRLSNLVFWVGKSQHYSWEGGYRVPGKEDGTVDGYLPLGDPTANRHPPGTVSVILALSHSPCCVPWVLGT